MPRLSLSKWLALIAFLIFYGFAVFALTRDYYLRHPTLPAPAAASDTPSTQRQPIETSAIPQSITETNPELLHQQADKFFMEQRFGEAMLVYKRIIELNPDDAEAYNALGLIQYYTGDAPSAIATLKLAVTKGATMQRNWLTLGFVNLKAGNKIEAKDALERARTLDPGSDVGKEAARLLAEAAK